MKKPGPKTALTKELFSEIKQNILDGKDLRATAKACKIPESTLYTWHSDNYLNLADKIEGWRRDRKLILAEKNIEEMLTLNTEVNVITAYGPIIDKVTNEPIKKTSAELLKIKKDTSLFVAETLGKNNYAKRSELTGAEGKELIPVSDEIKKKVNTSIDEYLKGHSK